MEEPNPTKPAGMRTTPNPMRMTRRPPPGQQLEDYDSAEITGPPSKRLKPNDHDHESATGPHSSGGPVANSASYRNYPPSTFEGLPPEVRLNIVESGLGIEDLRAAVRASPALHRQYRLADRRLMLRAALHTSLGPAVVDMWAAHRVAKMEWGTPGSTSAEKQRIAAL